ncbi:MAG TPA: nuclear transport factor 2 family protein [Paludibaculum sp.]|jgi:hypothetical protein
MLKLLPLLALSLLPIQAQSPPAPDPLYQTISALDSAMFDAYNRCQLEKFAAFLAADLEFYHDETGLSRGAQSTVEALRNNVCGKVRRELVPGTLRVFPLKGYGAVESGVHRFCDPKQGKCGAGSGEARFVHIWQNKDGAWKLARIISYDHCSQCVASDDSKPRP